MNELFSLAGKVALVTGAGRGMGQAIAVAFAQAGADVAIASRTESELEVTAEKIRAVGKKVALIPTDLSQSGSQSRLVETAVNELGKLDILLTSSGTIVRKPAFEVDEADWDTVVNLNLKGRFFLAQAAAKAMKESGGSI